MDNKEYRENQKIQRKEFKKYRKHMWKVIGYLLLAGASAFIFPYNLLVGLNGILKPLIGEYVADSITVLVQMLGMFGGVVGGIVNTYKAAKAKDAVDQAQDDEEEIVNSLIDEKDNLLKKVENLEKEKEKIITESKTVTKTEELTRSSSEYTEEKPKTKKYTR